MQALHTYTPAVRSSNSVARSQLDCPQLSSNLHVRHISSKDEDTAAAAGGAPQDAADETEQQAAADEQASDPKDQIIAEKDQQVCAACLRILYLLCWQPCIALCLLPSA